MANFNLNKVILGGRLTADPELKQTPAGVSVVTVSIAVKRKAKEAVTDFINVVAWRETAEFISKYFNKGSCICICGTIQTRNWTDEKNIKHYATEVIADEAYFVDSKADNSPAAAPVPEAPPVFNNPSSPKFEEVGNDDTLPF